MIFFNSAYLLDLKLASYGVTITKEMATHDFTVATLSSALHTNS